MVQLTWKDELEMLSQGLQDILVNQFLQNKQPVNTQEIIGEKYIYPTWGMFTFSPEIFYLLPYFLELESWYNSLELLTIKSQKVELDLYISDFQPQLTEKGFDINKITFRVVSMKY
jgi:hypothetical protein